ncbi:MAG: DUF4199 domain-containing protein [Paludibacter sp.]
MQPNIMKSAMHNGLILGAIFSVNFLLSVSGISALALLTYAVALIILVMLYKIAIRFRDVDCEGSITYGRAFLYILLIFFYAALISTVVKFIYLRFIDQTYLESIYQETMKVLEAMKFPMNTPEMEQAEKMFKPLNFSLLYIWSNMLLGTFVGLIMAAFIKKEKSLF